MEALQAADATTAGARRVARQAATWVAGGKGPVVLGILVASLLLPPTRTIRPSVPLEVAADPGGTAIELSWRLPARNGTGRLAGVHVYRDGALAATLSPAATSFVDAKVKPGVLHSYRVATFNRIGEGERSREIRASRFAVPAAPTSLTHDPVTVPGGVVLTWAAPPTDGGSLLTGYEVFRDDVSIALIEGRDTTTYTDENLAGGRDYIYEVAARNDVGLGGRSTPLVARVAPRPLRLSVKSTDTDPVRSTAPLLGGGVYMLEVSGTYTYGRGEADAECSTAGDDPQFLPNRYGFRAGGDPLDLMIGGVAVQWEPAVPTGQGCSVDHIYRYRLRPQATGVVEMSISDFHYPDNKGTLNITIYPQG